MLSLGTKNRGFGKGVVHVGKSLGTRGRDKAVVSGASIRKSSKQTGPGARGRWAWGPAYRCQGLRNLVSRSLESRLRGMLAVG